eukprot:362866-Chlamydomonas_euryale.AAC.22
MQHTKLEILYETCFDNGFATPDTYWLCCVERSHLGQLQPGHTWLVGTGLRKHAASDISKMTGPCPCT